MKFDLPAADDWRDVKVKVPARGSVAQLRVFLPADQGALEISALYAEVPEDVLVMNGEPVTMNSGYVTVTP